MPINFLHDVDINGEIKGDTLNIDGAADITGNITGLNGSLTTTSSYYQLNTPSGYIQMGAMNTGHAHMYTDRPDFYFNKAISINGANVLTTANTDAYFQNSDVVMNENPFGGRSLYNSMINNPWFLAADRYTVTQTGGTSIANAFNGDYESSYTVAANGTATFNIDFGQHPGYPYGWIYLSFYYTHQPSSISGRVYNNYAPHTVGWSALTFTDVVNTSQQRIVKARQSKYGLTDLEITLTAPAGTTVRLTSCEIHLDRPGTQEMPVFNKFRPETIYKALTVNSTITSTGKITGTELEGTSLDINGTADISGVLTAGGGTFSGPLTIEQNGDALNLRSTTNATKPRLTFSSDVPDVQIGHIEYTHSNTASYGGGEAFIIGGTEATTVVLADGQLMYKDGIYSKPASGTGAGTRKDSNWDSAYTHSTSAHAPSNAEQNVQSDWNATSGDALILNKPSIPSISGLASTSYVDTAVANVIDSAPGALDTLNELAAAINDDASFSTTVTNSIAAKLPLAGGTMSGLLTLEMASDPKLNLRVSSGDSTEWNYIQFIGSNGTRDAYFGTTNDGTPSWYRDDGATQLRLDSTKVYSNSDLQVNGELEAASLDINGAAAFDTNVNSGGFNIQTNSNAGSGAYVSRKWKNDESTFAEIWRNSSTRSSTGQAVRSFNIYNSHDTNIWSGGTRALHLDTSQNATFAGDVRLPNSGQLFLWNDHDANYLMYDKWVASASAGMTINNVAADGEIYLKSGNALTLTLDSSQNATFAGSISGNGKFIIANNGTATWGAANDYGQLSWDTGYALIRGQSGKGIKLQTNSSSTALTLDTSQNATFSGDVTLSGTAPTLRIQDSRNLNNPDWDSVSLGNIEFYTSDTTSPGARVLAEIEAFSNNAAASGPNADLIFKTSAIADSSPQTRLTIGYEGTATFAGNVIVGGTVDGVDIGANYSNWNTAYGWGDHASAGYLTGVSGNISVDSVNMTGELNFTGAGSKYIDVETLAGSNNLDIRHHNPTGNLFETAFRSTANGGTFLYYNGSTKFATTNTGISITGDISVSGTVDSRDVAADGTKLDTIDTNADVTPSWVPSSNPNYLTGAETIVAPASITTTIVDDTVNVSFAASTTSNIDNYLVFSSVAGSDYSLISIIPPDDMSANMSIIDNAFDASGTQAYRIYAVKNGNYSSPRTGSISFSAGTVEATNLNVVNLNKAFYIQWDAPSSKSRFVTAYNVYKHEASASADLSESSATLIYSGLNTNYMYSVSGSSNSNFHKFWVTTTVA